MLQGYRRWIFRKDFWNHLIKLEDEYWFDDECFLGGTLELAAQFGHIDSDLNYFIHANFPAEFLASSISLQ